jgi:hypothetical protein
MSVDGKTVPTMFSFLSLSQRTFWYISRVFHHGELVEKVQAPIGSSGWF